MKAHVPVFRPASTAALLLVIPTVAVWVRSYFAGDYVRLGPIYLSFARGYCRVVNARWPFDPNSEGDWYASMPLERVGEYHIGSGASYLPFWLITAILVLCWLWMRSKLLRSDAGTNGFPVQPNGMEDTQVPAGPPQDS